MTVKCQVPSPYGVADRPVALTNLLRRSGEMGTDGWDTGDEHEFCALMRELPRYARDAEDARRGAHNPETAADGD